MSGLFDRQKVRQYKNYRFYKKYLIEDFKSTCAYCLLPKVHLGGIKHFDIDHYEPVALNVHLISDYKNLYLSCKRCNSTKSDKWPDALEAAAGCRFFDACRDMPLDHYSFQPDGYLYAISQIGYFTLESLELNNPDSITIRRRIIALASQKSIEIDWNMPIDDIVNSIEP